MQRLGKNIGKYLGETIDVLSLLRELESVARSQGWDFEIFHKLKDFGLIALRRTASPQNSKLTKNIYISAGIHGDEPAGPLAVLQLLKENRWPENANIWICPCLNPAGFSLNTRENASGIDLNRQYLKTEAEEIKAHIAWLERQPRFDVSLCLHEDWESQGFYVYELNPDQQSSFAPAILKSVAEVCPIDMSPVIEDRPAVNGLINRLLIDSPNGRHGQPKRNHRESQNAPVAHGTSSFSV